MNVINIHPGILPIPPKNWGAIEKAIWNYHLNFEKLGISSQIKYLDEIKNDGYSIIHSHVTNLSNAAHERGLEYFFSMHDHHVMFDYPDPIYLEETRTAIKNSIKTIVHTPQMLVHKNFKDLAHKMIYVQHGADPEIYKDLKLDRVGDLLCVGSNGFINHKNFDRKGFLLAKQCAEFLNLKLTICSPSSNKDFFDQYGFFNSENVTIKFDLDEQELIEQYCTHKVFLHPSVLEAGDPNLTLTEAHFCGIKIVGSYHGTLNIDGMIVANDLTPTSFVNAIRIALNSTPDFEKNLDFTWKRVTEKLVGIYKKFGHTKKKFTDTLLQSYTNKDGLIHNVISNSKLKISFDMVPSVYLTTISDKTHDIKFTTIDSNLNENLVYQVTLSNNMWARPNDMYAENWKIYMDDELKFKTNINLNKNVCAVISTYPKSEDVKNKTKQTLTNIKDNINLNTICATHLDYEADKAELVNACDHYVMNPINTLTKHNYYRYYRGYHDGYDVFMDLWNSGNGSYHGPAVHQNYYNGVKKAKELGYKYALLTNFDMMFSEQDIDKIKCILNTLVINGSNGFFFFTEEPEGPTYKTVFCVVDVNMFLDVFPEINCEDDYNAFVQTVGSESNSLENVYYHALKNVDNLTIKQISELEFFDSQECFTNSQTDYFAAIPFENNSNYDVGVFIKRGNKNVLPYKIKVWGWIEDPIINSKYIFLEQSFDIESDFYKVIPIKLPTNENQNDNLTRTYNFVLISYDTSVPIYKSIVFKDITELQINGSIK